MIELVMLSDTGVVKSETKMCDSKERFKKEECNVETVLDTKNKI
jgi:hypothetical protein